MFAHEAAGSDHVRVSVVVHIPRTHRVGSVERLDVVIGELPIAQVFQPLDAVVGP